MSENKPVLIALALVAMSLVGFVIYYLSTSEDAPKTTNETVVIPEEKPAPPAPVVDPEPVAEPAPVTQPLSQDNAAESEPSFVLPRLDNSDQLIRDGVVSLTRHEGINRWLGTNELIRKTVVFIDNIAAGTVAKGPAAVLAPRGEMVVRQVSDKVFVMEEASYNRYNQVTNILISLDTRRAVEFFILLRPLFQQAYGELGYPDATFEDSIFRAIGRLLETPVLEGPVRLVRPVVVYQYEDPRLEALSPAQKQLLRMGPKNTRAIQSKLGEFARELRVVLER